MKAKSEALELEQQEMEEAMIKREYEEEEEEAQDRYPDRIRCILCDECCDSYDESLATESRDAGQLRFDSLPLLNLMQEQRKQHATHP